MINIEERRCEKLSGYTSLFVSFDFNVDFVNWIKQNIDIYNYNKKTHEWEITVTYLNSLIDYFNRFSDINIILYEEEKSRNTTRYAILKHELKPFKHQEEAINYGLQHNKWLLLDDMGLGKSKSIIHIAEELKAQAGLKHCLIVCGIATLRGNWKKEIKLHSNESFRVLGERINKNGNITYLSVKDRVEELLHPIEEFFIIVNIETLRSDDFVKAFKKNINNIDMIVCDEVHKASNSQSQQGSNFLKLDATYKIAATGTLLTNTPLNSYLPLKWIGMDKACLSKFKQQYCQFGGFGGHEIIGYKNIDILKDELDKCSLRRVKEDVLTDLPQKTIIKEIVTLSDEHKKFYDDVKKGVKEECDKINLNTSNLLSLVTRLRQASACPQILTTNNIKSSKLERAVDLATDLIESGEKVVIFSTFKDSVTKLNEMLSQYHPLICTGDSKESDINRNVDIFQTDANKKLLIATHQKMGVGITLNAASYMIFIDTPFTAAAFNQACDRIYRIGTKRPVFIYNLVCEGTIDERVSYIVESKEAMSNYIIDDKVDDKALGLLKEYILDL